MSQDVVKLRCQIAQVQLYIDTRMVEKTYIPYNFKVGTMFNVISNVWDHYSKTVFKK